MKCPCNPSKKYTECCKKVHINIKSAFTAEMLMRSRYSAFVLGNIDYLQKSHHSHSRPNNKEKKEIELWAKSVAWLKLDVLNSYKGSNLDNSGTVAFKAFYMENGTMNVIQENSKFCKENGHWVYCN